MLKKNKVNLFKIIFEIIFVIYIFVYFFYQNNYYEKKVAKDVYYNEENIKKFEEDIKNNKILDLDNYVIYDNKDYSNHISRFGEKINETLGKVFIKGTSKIVNKLKSLVWS